MVRKERGERACVDAFPLSLKGRRGPPRSLHSETLLCFSSLRSDSLSRHGNDSGTGELDEEGYKRRQRRCWLGKGKRSWRTEVRGSGPRPTPPLTTQPLHLGILFTTTRSASKTYVLLLFRCA